MCCNSLKGRKRNSPLGVLIDFRCKVIPNVAHGIDGILYNHRDVRTHRQSYCWAQGSSLGVTDKMR